MSAAKPTALILLNMGGPDSLEAIEPFLYNLFSDRELIQLPLGGLLQKPFAKLISHFRSKKVRESYEYIGGRSPLLEWTQKQAAGISTQLGEEFKPFVVMRYWHPRADEILAELKNQGITQAILLSMYPHYTGATTGSSKGKGRGKGKGRDARGNAKEERAEARAEARAKARTKKRWRSLPPPSTPPHLPRPPPPRRT